MECNKDEAIRAKTIAEKKLSDKDFPGAKKFILKAQNLYPSLDGISQMLTTLDVYIASENKISGEVDWYGILGANPNDDEETIRKHYRKLALLLHPDKNKSVGADGAFKLLSEAWSLLSDKTKRSSYNQRRSMRAFQQKVSVPVPPPSAPGANGAHTKQPPSKPNNRTTTTATRPPAPPPPSRPPPPPPPLRTDTFWTICHGCKMHYEYLKVFVNHTLICPNCRKPFHAVEMATPMNIPKPGYQYAYQWNQNSGDHGMCNSGRRMGASGIHWGSSSGLKVPDDMLRREGGVFYGQPPLKRRKVEVRFGEN